MAKREKVHVHEEREVRTYAELWHASECVLNVGLREPQGSAWQFLSSLVLTAFAFEAYLNHIGPSVLASWSGLERLPPWSKLELLCDVLKVDLPTKGARPVQTVLMLSDFRNKLAHGRTATLTSVKLVDAAKWDDVRTKRSLTDWEQLIRNADFAQRAREDVAAVLGILHAAWPGPKHGLKEHLFTFGAGSWSARLERTD